jgi:hypothetical protein
MASISSRSAGSGGRDTGGHWGSIDGARRWLEEAGADATFMAETDGDSAQGRSRTSPTRTVMRAAAPVGGAQGFSGNESRAKWMVIARWRGGDGGEKGETRVRRAPFIAAVGTVLARSGADVRTVGLTRGPHAVFLFFLNYPNLLKLGN